MICNPAGNKLNKASKRYTRRLAAVMFFYMLTVWRVTPFVRTHHLSGRSLYIASALPTIPVIVMLVVVGLYLREERDEYARQQTVVSMLWAIAITLGFTAFTDFLRSYGAIAAVPPFTEFCLFWLSMGVVSAVQTMRNRVGTDEE